MAAYGKDDFVFSGLDDYDFSDYSDEESDQAQNSQSGTDSLDIGKEDDVPQYCICSGVLTKEMIACDGERCNIEWWHYGCAGVTADTLPEGNWLCPKCLPTQRSQLQVDLSGPSTSTATDLDDLDSSSYLDDLPSTSGLQKSQTKSRDATTQDQPNKEGETERTDGEKTTASTGQEKGTANKCKNSRKAREKAPERPKATFSKTDALALAVSLFVTSLQDMKNHPIFNCGSEASLGILGLITHLLLCTQKEAFVDLCKSTISNLWTVLTSSEGKVLKPEGYENMWRKFHDYRMSSCTKWEGLLDSLGFPETSEYARKLTYQYLIQAIFGKLMKERNCTDLPEKEISSNSEMDREEEKVLRYVAGYIPFALMKMYKKQVNKTAKMYCTFLEYWSVQSITSGRTFLSYTKEWIDAQNRGRLFKVSDDVYLFFRSMEVVSRQLLTTSNLQNMSEININKLLLNKITTNYRVQTYWCTLTDSKLNGESSKVFLEIIIRYYIKIRCKAFLKVYLDIRKASSKQVSKKGEKALRKDL